MHLLLLPFCLHKGIVKYFFNLQADFWPKQSTDFCSTLCGTPIILLQGNPSTTSLLHFHPQLISSTFHSILFPGSSLFNPPLPKQVLISSRIVSAFYIIILTNPCCLWLHSLQLSLSLDTLYTISFSSLLFAAIILTFLFLIHSSCHFSISLTIFFQISHLHTFAILCNRILLILF